jgi:hypothetical protein
MAFDKDTYRDTYLRPNSRLKLAALRDDIFERYAIALPSSDAEIVATIKAVRSFWSTQQAGTPAAKYAKMCIAADEELKQQKVESGPHRGKDMLTAAWWQAKKDEQDGAAKDRMAKLAALLKDSNGAFGVVTRSYLATCAERLSLAPGQAEQAAKDTGLQVVDDVDIPDDPPIAQYAQLENDLGVGQVKSIPELVHPGSTPFRIVGRYQSIPAPHALLDIDAVKTREMEASRQAHNSPTWNARRSALNMLRSAAAGGADLRKIALYHLIRSAAGSGVPGAAGIKAELIGRGLEERDASILAVVVAERAGTAGASGSARAEQLLQEGRLREAIAVAAGLPDDSSDSIEQLKMRIETAKAKLEALLDQARKLLAVPDEIGAAVKVREASTISSEDADEVMALVPMAPPRDMKIDVDENKVRLHWQPNVGHDEETIYRVVRSIHGPPMNEVNGSPVPSVTGTSVTDAAPPVARPVYYSVFATTAGRPSSRPACADTVSLPPVREVRVETGPDWVSAQWLTHPAVHHVEAVRRDGGRTTPVPVQLAGAKVTGLPEGESVHIELTAIYESPAGAALRSSPVMVAGTPRAVAKPLENLRVQPIAGPHGVQVRLVWTPVDRSDVRFKRSSSAPRWNVGELIAVDEMSAWGVEVTGSTDNVTDQVRLAATLPPGVHYLVPFSIGGTGVVVGRTQSVGVTDPVMGLEATAFQGSARLAWTWPSTSSLAEVTWERDDSGTDAVGLERISRPEYDKRGALVPLGTAPCEVSVRALMVVDGNTYSSPPAIITVGQVLKSPVTYKIASSPRIGPLGGRTKKLTLTASEDTGPLHIALVASPGIVIPSAPAEGLTILDRTVDLVAGKPLTLSASVPSVVGRQYWVRCFLISGNAQLQDPPINALKEG